MLGARTKQVTSYGKRNRRIVDISNGSLSRNSIPSIFDDLPPAPKVVAIAAKMKKRENIVPSNPKHAGPTKVAVGMQKKRRLSPVLSPLRKKRVNRVAQIIEAESRKLGSQEVFKLSAQKSTGSTVDPRILSSTPSRAPLSTVPVNHVNSPAISKRHAGKQRMASAQETPLRLKNPSTPFVDMDIIVLDDEGRTMRQERRISRPNVEINPINHDVSRMKKKGKDKTPPAHSPNESASDSELEVLSQPMRPKRLGRRAAPIIISDSETNDDETPLAPPSKPPPPKANSDALPHPKPPKLIPPDLSLEVVVPPAPYRLHSAPTLAVKSQPARAVTPPPRQPPVQLPVLQNRVPHQQVPSLVAKPRQLTPIRGVRRNGLFEPPSPPSPTTPTDFDLSLEFDELSLGSPSQNYSIEPEIPEYLRPLLEECGQESCGAHEFSAFIESFPYDPVIQGSKEHDLTFRKIGEASYSEVFGIGDVVLKVIPLRNESEPTNSSNMPNARQSQSQGWETDEDGPAPSDAKDVLKEIIVTRAMGEVYEGFVKLLKTYIVRGRYPEVLLRLWDDYNDRKGSESVRPDTFNVSQVYAIIVLPNGGPDLEAYNFSNPTKTGWRQACSLFWQVAKALAHAEQLVSFEHRDLHWGQILVKNLPMFPTPPLKAVNTNQKTKPKALRLPMDDPVNGVQATLIDLGLSRMDAGDGQGGERVHWTPFDEEVFMGEGDYQFDVYRMMRNYTMGAWEDFHPLTNVMWLHYLALKLIQSKGLKTPTAPRKTKGAEATVPAPASAFTERDCYECLLDIEDWLGRCVAEFIPAKTKSSLKSKGRRKTQAIPKLPPSGPACAGEIVGYAAKKGWIKSTS
ncbi:hypothetical protein BDQ12DRAFT_643394 [Crucibulum laeve]|uniref:non-specific serine/threonine protein kinase n=1 Tax=Crucibulum laeve TaxID=68775 RepID=A0A5C3MGF1_9AGAR|nr:hypothetical protein BDQ12DRAFT_643394 [Crucibulum laeve]